MARSGRAARSGEQNKEQEDNEKGNPIPLSRQRDKQTKEHLGDKNEVHTRKKGRVQLNECYMLEYVDR